MVETAENCTIRKDVLAPSGYPMLSNTNGLKKNAQFILEYVKTVYHGKPVVFVGTGTSGAMAITSILLANDGHGWMLLAKPKESSHRGEVEGSWKFIHDPHVPLVIVDDVVCSGGTIERIQNVLRKNGYLGRVECVAIYSSDYHKIRLKQLFPNLKHIIA